MIGLKIGPVRPRELPDLAHKARSLLYIQGNLDAAWKLDDWMGPLKQSFLDSNRETVTVRFNRFGSALGWFAKGAVGLALLGLACRVISPAVAFCMAGVAFG